jgi:type I restriction enzyme S subunit
MRAETTFDRRVTKHDFNDMPMIIPPLSVQREVADQLDAATYRIDALIQARRRQLELIGERKRSIIDRLTVPRALGGAADGITAWPVSVIKRAADYFSDGDWIESPYITTDGIRLIQTGNVGEGQYKEQGFRYISEETFRSLNCTEVLPGDILISRLAGPVGCACLAPDLGVRMVVSVDVVIMRPTPALDASFAVAYLSSSRHLALAELLARGTTMQRLSRSQLGDMPIPLPPIDEQRRAVRQIDLQLARLRSLSASLIAQIDLLIERRQTLVADAVMGQLRVAEASE